MIPRALALLCLLLFPSLVAAQTATLAADRIEISGDAAITAEGNVEVLYQSTRLTAARVRYERAGERLLIDGPITLRQGDSYMVLADAAELDADLRNGILRSARLVLDRQLQLASDRIDRVEGRYTQLSRSVATSCRICDESEVPIWEIRARRVIHDEELRQIFFEGAQLRFVGVPLAYLPRFRMPDPTLKRATGFLFPEIRSNSLLGTGIRIPYFVVLGDHADLRLTPYLSPKTTTLEAIFRQELSFGDLALRGAFSRDTLIDSPRAYLFGNARFRLPDDYRLNLDFELVSDPSYLIDYDFSGKDRLDSAAVLSRTRDDGRLEASVTAFRTLRGDNLAVKDQTTDLYANFVWERRLPTLGLGGDAWLQFDASALTRPSALDGPGRDVGRVGAGFVWHGERILPAGLLAGAEVSLRADAYSVSEDSNFEPTPFRMAPSAMVELRWPFARTTASGASEVLEPIAQLAWSRAVGDEVPNEDSALVDFDQGNLFGLSRYPGVDRIEEGLRANLGLQWTRVAANGWSGGFTLGRVFRLDDTDQFADGSGLAGDRSDWLFAFHYDLKGRARLTSRSLFDDRLEFNRSETKLDWRGGRYGLASSYTYIRAEPAEDRFDPVSELTVDAAYDFTGNWTGRVDWRYDTIEGQAARAGAGLRYQNECIGFDLSVSRRFTSSDTVSPSTNFTFAVTFDGTGTGSDRRAARRSCRG